MGHPRYSTDEIIARGQEIYEQKLKGKLEAQNRGKFLVIDIETEEYEMDEDDLQAALRAYHKNPGDARYEMQIGYATSGTAHNDFIPAQTGPRTRVALLQEPFVYDSFGALIGKFHSGNGSLSQNTGKQFTDIVVEKHNGEARSQTE